MKRILSLTVALVFATLFFSGCAVANPGVRFFGVVTDGNILRLDVFSSNLRLRLGLNEYQCARVQDVLSDCQDQVIIVRSRNMSDREYERWCRTRYADTDRRIIAILTPAQLRAYRSSRGDVHNWIHEQRNWRDDGPRNERRAEGRDGQQHRPQDDRRGERHWN